MLSFLWYLISPYPIFQLHALPCPPLDSWVLQPQTWLMVDLEKCSSAGSGTEGHFVGSDDISWEIRLIYWWYFWKWCWISNCVHGFDPKLHVWGWQLQKIHITLQNPLNRRLWPSPRSIAKPWCTLKNGSQKKTQNLDLLFFKWVSELDKNLLKRPNEHYQFVIVWFRGFSSAQPHAFQTREDQTIQLEPQKVHFEKTHFRNRILMLEFFDK